mgnify:FL=1
MRRCPKCKNWTLDVQPEMDYPQEEDEEEHYFFRCWTCDFECSLKQAEKNMYSSRAFILKGDEKKNPSRPRKKFIGKKY